MKSLSKSCKMMYYSHIKSNDAIRSQFCTCHDSWAVEACAKLYTRNQTLMERNYQKSSIKGSQTLCDMDTNTFVCYLVRPSTQPGVSMWWSHGVLAVIWTAIIRAIGSPHTPGDQISYHRPCGLQRCHVWSTDPNTPGGIALDTISLR